MTPDAMPPTMKPPSPPSSSFWTRQLPVFLAFSIPLGWVLWALVTAAQVPPAHDEIITLLNMRDAAMPLWADFAGVAEHQRVFTGPLAGFDAIGPMLRTTDVHPPLYYHVALAVSHVFGDDLWHLRLLSIAMSTLGGAWILLLCHKTLRDGAYLWALPLLAACLWSASTVAYAGINARNYALVLLLSAALAHTLMAFVAARSDARRRWAAVAMGLASVALVWTHYFGIIAATAAFLAAFVCTVRDKRALLDWTIGGTIAALGLIALVPWLDAHLHARSEQYTGFGGWGVEAMAMARILAEQFSFLSTAPWSDIPLLLTLPFVVALAILAIAPGRARGAATHGSPLSTNPIDPNNVRIATKHDIPTTQTGAPQGPSASDARGTTRRGAAVFFVAGVLGLALVLLLFWATDKTLRTMDSSRYGMFVLAFLYPLVAQGARRLMLPLVGLAALCAAQWIDGERRVMPWEWEHAFQEALVPLTGQDTIVILDNRSRGVAGSIVYRAQGGWIGFTTGTASPLPIGATLPSEARNALLLSYGTDSPPAAWEGWRRLLAEEGFQETSPNVWHREAPIDGR